MSSQNIESVWMHKKTGQLYEHFMTVFGWALVCVDLEGKHPLFTDWHDWVKRGLFYFNDCAGYNPENYIDLGEL